LSERRSDMRVVIRDVAGTWAVALPDGQQVHDLIAPAIARGEVVELDFAGVEHVSPPFLNPVVSWLIQEQSPARVLELLRFENLSPLGQNLLGHIIDLGTRMWASPAYREAVEKVMRARSEDR